MAEKDGSAYHLDGRISMKEYKTKFNNLGTIGQAHLMKKIDSVVRLKPGD